MITFPEYVAQSPEHAEWREIEQIIDSQQRDIELATTPGSGLTYNPQDLETLRTENDKLLESYKAMVTQGLDKLYKAWNAERTRELHKTGGD